MDADLERAIALSLQAAENVHTQRLSQEEKDLQLALELSQQNSQRSNQRIPSFQDPLSEKTFVKKSVTEVVEIQSSDDEDMDPDLKLAIQLSKTAHGTMNESIDSNITSNNIIGVSNSQNIIDEDMQLALELQKQFDDELKKSKISPAKSISTFTADNRGNKANLCDPEWETIDPNPDIHSLFIQFDQRFFWNSLGAVELEWSRRMYTCAGICYYQRRGPFEQCNIRLSQPLLALRPRGDLVNTLIHEMIHAFLFVTRNDRDRDGHGPRFQAHMNRINREAGTNITIYHEWHEETDYYKKHIWRCNGPCRYRKPFFGFVKRVSNRKPGPNDRWFPQHQSSCGGVFEKIGEPTPKKRGPSKRRKIDQSDASKNVSVSRQPRIDVAMGAGGSKAHVMKTTRNIQHNEDNSKNNSFLQKSRETELGPKTESLKEPRKLGGRNDGVSRLLFPDYKKPNMITTASGKQFKITHFFSSDEDN